MTTTVPAFEVVDAVVHVAVDPAAAGQPEH